MRQRRDSEWQVEGGGGQRKTRRREDWIETVRDEYKWSVVVDDDGGGRKARTGRDYGSVWQDRGFAIVAFVVVVVVAVVFSRGDSRCY